MAHSFDCHCGERTKPLAERRWVVDQRCCNHSAFNGYHWTASDYSTVRCLSCGAVGRTKAKYVGGLRDDEVEAAYANVVRMALGTTCDGCKFWSELIASCDGDGPVKAMCLNPDSPRYNEMSCLGCDKHTPGRAIDDPSFCIG